jgi:hypothetical protein
VIIAILERTPASNWQGHLQVREQAVGDLADEIVVFESGADRIQVTIDDAAVTRARARMGWSGPNRC